MAQNSFAVQPPLSPVALRMAGLALLFVAFGSLLAAQRSLTTHETGALVLAFCAVMTGAHLLTARPPSRRAAESNLAALLAAATLPVGMLLVFWQRPGLDATVFLLFGVANGAASNALLATALVAVAAFAAGRQPRWLLLAPLALVAGIQFSLASGRSEPSVGDGSWTRVAVFAISIAALVAGGRVVRGAVERNLLIAAGLLAPFMLLSVPGSDGAVARDLIGVAMLIGFAAVVRDRLTPGTGAGLLLLALAEIGSLASHGATLMPGLLAGAAAVALIAVSARGALAQPNA